MSLETFLSALDSRSIAYRLDRVRDAVMVVVVIPGERWEVEFFADGTVEAECFRSDGQILDETVLNDILSRGE